MWCVCVCVWGGGGGGGGGGIVLRFAFSFRGDVLMFITSEPDGFWFIYDNSLDDKFDLFIAVGDGGVASGG